LGQADRCRGSGPCGVAHCLSRTGPDDRGTIGHRLRERTGRWPESLDQIVSALSPEILSDPISGGSYVYNLSESGFSLYSIGPNRVDEHGHHKWNGPDDWPIWPPRGRSAEPEQEKQ